MDITGSLTSIGALGGLTYAVSNKKSFWTTAGLTILFALAGTAIGTGIKMVKN